MGKFLKLLFNKNVTLRLILRALFRMKWQNKTSGYTSYMMFEDNNSSGAADVCMYVCR